MNQMNIKDMDCARLLDALTAQGVILSANDGELRLFGSDEVLGTADIVDAVRKHKASLLELLASQQNGGEAPLVANPEARHDAFPLTDIQRAYWVGRQDAFDHGNVAIHFYTEVEVPLLDHARFQAAWNKVVRHHDMLRCVVDADAMQRILPDVPDYEIEVIDLSADAEADRVCTLEAHREKASHTVHKSDVWPGFALTVFKIDEQTSRLCYSQDLLHVDGGSLLLVIEDLCRFYLEPDYDKPASGLQFRDFVFHEIAIKDSAAYQEHLAYWEDVVADLPPPPALPVSSSEPEGRFRRLAFDLPPESYACIKAQAQALGITTTGWVMAAFGEIISRWSGSEDCTLNVTVFNRPSLAPDLLKIVGDFTSMIPVAMRHGDGDTLAARGTAMQRRMWDHIAHRDVSGITILNMLRSAKKDKAAADLSVVFTSLLNLGSQGFSAEGFHKIGQPVFTLTQTPQVTLDHQVSETNDGGIAFTWDVVEGHYPDGMVEDMFEAFRGLVSSLVADSDAWNDASLEYLPKAQLHLFNAVNATAAPYPADATLQSMFEHSAKAYPDAPALATAGRVLSYAQVRSAALTVAHDLKEAGVSAGQRVGIMMPKGWEQPVAALGVHFAGGAYVPIDPETPKARFEHIVEDAGLAALLVVSDQAPELRDFQVPVLAVEASHLARSAEAIEPVVVAPDDTSHVIYTSGSTGLPKGVVISHRNVVNRVSDINGRFEIHPDDAAIGLTALHHDLSVFDIFGVFAAGATLVLPDEERRLDPAHWLELMAAHKVTLWNSVPAFAGMLADHLEDRALEPPVASLRWMILAGDWIPVSLPDRLRAHVPDLDLIASGGPTETTIWDIWNRVGRVDPNWPSIPYGKPLANAGYHITDRSGRPCPVWVAGELCISGVGVTQGYLNRPDLNAEKYISLANVDGRVFKSGDMGRMLPDGNIEFLGRSDFQVKINGMRIELGEIERVANAVPGVSESTAVVQNAGKEPSIALFFTKKKAGFSPADLAAQNAAFEERGVIQTDPAERLASKLEYSALTIPDGATAIGLDAPAERPSRFKSHRTFRRKMMSRAALSGFLSHLSGTKSQDNGEARFAYGSGGGLYPVQVYLYLKPEAVSGLRAGIYRYHPLDHALTLVNACVLPDDIHWGYNRAFSNAAPMYLYLVADLTVIEAQYGDLARQMCALEAGAMGQILRQAADTSEIGICPVGDISFERTADAFRLHEKQHLMLAMVAGHIDRDAEAETLDSLDMRLDTALRDALPRYMVPQHCAALDTLPLTANGKVDRKTLQSLEVGRRDADAFVAPEGSFEAAVSKILAELLDRSAISATDNFFDIGASSAILVKAYNGIKTETGRTFPLIALFKHPSVRQLAQALEAAPETPEKPDVASRASRQSEALKKLKSNRNRK